MDMFAEADKIISQAYPGKPGYWGETKIPNYGILRGAIVCSLSRLSTAFEKKQEADRILKPLDDVIKDLEKQIDTTSVPVKEIMKGYENQYCMTKHGVLNCAHCYEYIDCISANPRIINDEWISVKDKVPQSDITVIVPGGIAKYRNGTWYTGMEEPMFGRPIEWTVTHWRPFPEFKKDQKLSKHI